MSWTFVAQVSVLCGVGCITTIIACAAIYSMRSAKK